MKDRKAAVTIIVTAFWLCYLPLFILSLFLRFGERFGLEVTLIAFTFFVELVM